MVLSLFRFSTFCVTTLFCIFALFSSIFFSVAFAAETLDNATVFEKIKAGNEKDLGKKIEARLESSLLSLQLKNIPKEMVEFGKKPELYLIFHRGKKPELVLKNVSPFYNSFFSPYEEILQKSGLFLGVDNHRTLESFSKEFTIEKIEKTTNDIKAMVKEKDGLEGDYAIFYYDDDYRLKHADFYEANELTAIASFFFKKAENNKRVPFRLSIKFQKEQDAANHFLVNLKDYLLL